MGFWSDYHKARYTPPVNEPLYGGAGYEAGREDRQRAQRESSTSAPSFPVSGTTIAIVLAAAALWANFWPAHKSVGDAAKTHAQPKDVRAHHATKSASRAGG